MTLKLKIPKLIYKNHLGEVLLKNVYVTVDESDLKKYKKGTRIDDLDYGFSGKTIDLAEREIAKVFFKKKYRSVLNAQYLLSVSEISAIQDLLGLNNVEFSQLLGIDKASLSNIYKREKLSRSVCLLIMERLGMELSQKGSAKKIVDPSAPLSELDNDTILEINEIRFGEVAA